MYLALSDKLIDAEQQKTFLRCKEISKRYDSMTWWRKILSDTFEDSRREIFREWQKFQIWETLHIAKQRRRNHDAVNKTTH
jgi:hypothetical protein